MKKVKRAFFSWSKLVLISSFFVMTNQSFASQFSVKSFRPWNGYGISNGIWLNGDVNADGKEDIIHAVDGRDYVHVWISNGDGSFQVKTFSPWPGYGIPNGVWLCGDYNGDGKADIVHAVQGKDYVHTWFSNGDGSFNVTSFRPWPGYGIVNGQWLTGDFNADGKADIVHAVQGADYIHTWFSNGNGTFNITSYRPWNGYGISNGIWATGDFNGDRKIDLIHAVKGTDYVHTWLSSGNGNYTVGTFRPWGGYGIPTNASEFMIADFNGDGKSDVAHTVGGRDYIHTWFSLGTGSFNVTSFRPWPGYGIPNGVWRVGDFDADGKADLLHAVQGRDYTHIWNSRGNGNYSVSTFSPWQGYGIPNGRWIIADLNGDKKMDVLHCVQNADYTHPWLSTMPKNGEFSVDRIEISQSVQDHNQSVPLVADKRTLARVYLNFKSSSPMTVRGVLRVFSFTTGSWTSINSIASLTVNPSQNGKLNQKRSNLSNSLNFELPAALRATGTYNYQLFTITNSAGTVQTCSDCVTTSVNDQVEATLPMPVRVIGLRYTQTSSGGATRTHEPRALDFNLTRSWLIRAYPTSALNWSSTTVTSSNTWPFLCGAANTQIAAIRNLDINAGTDERTHYYGLVSDGGGFMRGCSAGIPGTADPTVVASGPAGSNTFGWDTDNSYADWYTGHELGHTYGRMHPGFCNQSHDDRSYPYPEGQISPNDSSYVGLDMGDVALGIAMRALPGTEFHDVMTYCTNQWLGSYTYMAILTRLRAENSLAAGAPNPFSDMAGMGPQKSSDWPEIPAIPKFMVIKPAMDKEPEIITGAKAMPEIITMTTKKFKAPSPAGEPQKPSVGKDQVDPTLNFKTEKTEKESNNFIITYYADISTTSLMELSLEANSGLTPSAEIPEIENGDFIGITATINLTKETAKLQSTDRLTKAILTNESESSHVLIQLKDSKNNVLLSFKAPVKLDTDLEPKADQTGIIDCVIKYVPNIAKIEILINDKVVDFKLVSQRIPRAIQSSGQKSMDNKGNFKLAWKAQDPDGGTIVYHILASTDGGKSWSTVEYNSTKTNYQISKELYDQSKSVLIKIIASDGFNNTVVKQDTLNFN